MSDSQRAVIDRIVDERHAVLLIGKDEVEAVLPVADLPSGSRSGDWLFVTHDEGGQVRVLGKDEEATGKAEGRVASKLDELRQRGSRFQPE